MIVLVTVLLVAFALVIATLSIRGHARRVVRCPNTGGIAQVETGTLNEVLTFLFPKRRYRMQVQRPGVCPYPAARQF